MANFLRPILFRFFPGTYLVCNFTNVCANKMNNGTEIALTRARAHFNSMGKPVTFEADFTYFQLSWNRFGTQNAMEKKFDFLLKLFKVGYILSLVVLMIAQRKVTNGHQYG